MKIRMLKQTVCNGKIVVPGDVLETSDKDARILIGMAKAIETTEDGEQQTTEDGEQQTEDGEGQETETQQKPRGKSKGKQSPNNRMDEVDQTRTDG